MKIAVIGAGGVGGYFGGKLAAAGYDVTFLVRGGTLKALNENGLRVESIDGDFVVRPAKASEDPANVGHVDFVLLGVKAWQLDEAAKSALPMVGPGTVVVPLQNGIDAPAVLETVVGAAHTAGGLCAIVSFVVEPGVIRHAGARPIVMFGDLEGGPSKRLEPLREAFARAGVDCEIPPDIRHSMWTKFLFIAPLSGIGAVSRVPVGQWRENPETRALATRALREIEAVAAAEGVNLGREAIERTLARYDGLPSDSTASLQRDVMAGRPSELDAQIGTVVRLARKHSIDVPVHETILASLLPNEELARKK